ncbi:MAG: LlaJI family restriction endonuclease [Lachnospiraceae bacterium]|nr:LlaJI family restriction endonuclease [Lachnospiraceae bacterium]
MVKGFFRERKHYTLQTIADNLYEKNADLEETRHLIGILKKYGVVKAVKRTKSQFDDLLNEDIVLADVVDNSGDIEYVFDYVGVVMLEGHVFKCYPKYIKSTNAPVDELKQVLKVIKKYNSSEQLIYLFNGEDDSRIFNKLAVALYLLEDYHTNGLYTNQREIVEVNGEGDILWDKTINETFAIIQNNKPYYVELQTKNTVDNDLDYFRRLHECVLTICSRELENVGLLQLFDLSEVNLSQVELSDFGDDNYILYRLQGEIQSQYVIRKQNLLKTIYTYVANEKTDKDDISYSLYGTNSFNLVWEKVCAENFGSVLDRAIVDLPLCNLALYMSENEASTLRNVIKAPRWRKSEYPMVKDPKVETLKPDLVCIYPVDEERKAYCFGIYDAKYYCIDYQVSGDRARIAGQPGVGDVTKQYLYQLAFDDFITKQGYQYVQNMFFCPDETADKNYGWVQMDMLHQIGDKKLENIAIVKLCATEMYDFYLANKTIDEKEFGKYIPIVGRQEVESQNFANRMLAYLKRITNASKMAENKLEMKADRGKIIYPKQIKRELGAKIIYDVICPVASKAFYGFDPYEKEAYGAILTEDVGNSYNRCSQIADAAIEIEKIIKKLSEQELQDETVLRVVLKKCFESKADIGSMAEGKCLEMLTEKVMELARNVYL